MGVMDGQLLFGEAIDLGSTSAGSAVSGTNTVEVPQVVDHKGSSVNDRINEGGKLQLNVTVEDEDLLASSSSAALTIKLLNASSVSSIASGDIVVQKTVTVAATTTTLPDGTVLMQQPLPQGRFKPIWGVNFAVATKKLLTGKVTAWIGLANQSVES